MTETVAKYKAFAAKLLRDPDDVESLVNQWALLANEGKKEKTEAYYRLAKRARALDPNHFLTLFNLAGASERTGRYAEALELYQKCKTTDHDLDAELLHDIGVCYRGLGDNVRAIEWYDKAIALKPTASYRRDRAISMMAGATMGTHSLVDAFEAFEARRDFAEEKFRANGALVSQKKLPPNAVHWKGEDLTGKSVVVYHEEGSGDFIQFCRFLPRLHALGISELRLTGPLPDLLDMVSDNIAVHGIVPLTDFECDYVIGSMTLPWRLGVEYADIDSTPYLGAVPASIPKRGDLNVGLVWRGNPVYRRDHHRSMPLETLVPLFDMPGVAFYSLQVGEAAGEITKLGFDGFLADLQPFMKTWRQTARVIAALDVVVTVDTAVAHLAGAMGKPVVIMVTNGCDWRWNRDSDKTAWYASARVARQSRQDDWTPCIEYVRLYLRDLLDGRRRQSGVGSGEGATCSVAAE